MISFDHGPTVLTASLLVAQGQGGVPPIYTKPLLYHVNRQTDACKNISLPHSYAVSTVITVQSRFVRLHHRDQINLYGLHTSFGLTAQHSGAVKHVLLTIVFLSDFGNLFTDRKGRYCFHNHLSVILSTGVCVCVPTKRCAYYYCLVCTSVRKGGVVDTP